MRYKESLIPTTTRDLKAIINVVMLYAPARKFDDFAYDFDGAFYSLEQGVTNLSKKFGEEKAKQLRRMLAIAKSHYEGGDNRLGGALMEDAKMVIINRQPWAYPRDLYQWPVDPSSPDLSEADLMNKN